MGNALGWIFAGFLTAILLGIALLLLWRELDKRRHGLEQLARQVNISHETASKAQNGPYAQSAQHALESSLCVYREAQEQYELLRRNVFCRLPAFCMGFAPADYLDNGTEMRGEQER